MTIGEKIRELREAKGLTQKQLGQKLGEAKGTIVSNWEIGASRPDCERIVQLCSIFNVSADELLGVKVDAYRFSPEEWTRATKIRMLDEHGKAVVDYLIGEEYKRVMANGRKKNRPRLVYIDSYSYPVSAGVGSFVETEAPEKILVPECAESEEADYVLTVKGYSMEPEFSDGDKVYVVQQPTIDVGEIGIFIINDEAFIKKLGKGQLISLNPEYKPISFKKDDSIYCCGKVIGIVEE